MARSRPHARPIAVGASTAAEMLDCSRQHVHQLIERGTLRSLRIEGSRAVRIPIEDIYGALGLDAPSGDAS